MDIRKTDYSQRPLSTETIDLAGLFNIIRRRIVLGAPIAAVVGLATLLLTMQQTPVFTAQTMVVLDTRDKDVIADSVLSALGKSQDVVDTEVKVIGSRGLAIRVADALDLYSVPEFNGSLQVAPLRTIAVHAARGIRYLTGSFRTADLMSRTAKDTDRVAREAVVSRLMSHIHAYRDGLTFAIVIQASSFDPRRAALIADTYAAQYAASQSKEKLEATERANKWLGSQLAQLGSDVRDAEDRVEQFRSEAGLLDAHGTTLTEQEVGELTTQLVSARADMAQRSASYNTYRRLGGEGSSAADLSKVTESPLISGLRAQEAAIAKDVADAAARYGPEHPRRIRLEQQLRDIRSSINEQIGRVGQGIKLDAEISQRRVADLQKRSDDLTTKLASNKQAQVRLRELERESEAAAAVYQNFLSRLKEVSAQIGMQEPDVKIVSPAAIPTAPSAPKSSIAILLGLVIGTASGLFAIVVAELLAPGFRTPDGLETTTGLPCVAAIPEVTHTKAPWRLVIRKPNSMYVEGIKALYADISMHQRRQDGLGTVVVISSALSGEAKTTTAISLAFLASQYGLRTLLVDADGRRQTLSRLMKHRPEKSLSDLLNNSATIEEAAVKAPDGAPDIIPANGPEAIEYQKIDFEALKHVMDNFRSHYDLTVIDTPPLLAMVEARWFARFSDLSYLTVRWRKTPKAALQAAITLASRSGIDISGLVLASVNSNSEGLYGRSTSPQVAKSIQKYFVSG